MDYCELYHILMDLLVLQYTHSVDYIDQTGDKRDPIKTYREEGAALACHVIIQAFLDIVTREEDNSNASNN